MRTVEVSVDDLYLLLGFVNIIRRSVGGGKLTSTIYEMLHKYIYLSEEKGIEDEQKG